jgi:predicted nucleic acid-binding protein
VTVVVDASVAIKWFVRESLHREALRLLDKPEDLHAPDLIAAEVTNIAWKKVRLGEVRREQATEIAGAIRQGSPLLYPVALYIERALEIAFALDHPVYDSLYIACAEALDGMLITADDKLYRSAQKAGFERRVMRLA